MVLVQEVPEGQEAAVVLDSRDMQQAQQGRRVNLIMFLSRRAR